MRIPYWTEFIRACRFSRQEENYYTAETIPVGPQEQIIYVRPLCAGQQLNLKVFSLTLVTIQILSDGDADQAARESLQRNSGVGSIDLNFKVKRAGWHLISIANEVPQPTDFSVVIEASKRSLCLTTIVEKAVCRIWSLR